MSERVSASDRLDSDDGSPAGSLHLRVFCFCFVFTVYCVFALVGHIVRLGWTEDGDLVARQRLREAFKVGLGCALRSQKPSGEAGCERQDR